MVRQRVQSSMLLSAGQVGRLIIQEQTGGCPRCEDRNLGSVRNPVEIVCLDCTVLCWFQ